MVYVLQACASLGSGYETPSVSITTFKPVSSTGAIPQFLIGLHVVNPNRQPLALEGVAYTISLEGHEVMTGASNDLPVVEGYGEADFTLTATVSLFQGIGLIGDLMSSPREILEYELRAKLDVGAMQPAIRVTRSGEISLRP